MNFMPAHIEGDTLRLPMVEAKIPDELRGQISRAGDGGGRFIAGIRPEGFEDAALVGDERDRGAVFRTKIDVVESMGSELYAHFGVDWNELDSGELRELAQDGGTARLMGGSGEGEAVARLDAASRATGGEEAELWLDLTKLHLFDSSGASLTR
jgi:multiple sugar transport system ATP-binding protein